MKPKNFFPRKKRVSDPQGSFHLPSWAAPLPQRKMSPSRSAFFLLLLVVLAASGVSMRRAHNGSHNADILQELAVPLTLFAQAHWQEARSASPDALLAGYADGARLTVRHAAGGEEVAEGIVAIRDVWFGSPAAARKRTPQGLAVQFRVPSLQIQEQEIYEGEQKATALFRIDFRDGSHVEWRDEVRFQGRAIVEERLEEILVPAIVKEAPSNKTQ